MNVEVKAARDRGERRARANPSHGRRRADYVYAVRSGDRHCCTGSLIIVVDEFLQRDILLSSVIISCEVHIKCGFGALMFAVMTPSHVHGTEE